MPVRVKSAEVVGRDEELSQLDGFLLGVDAGPTSFVLEGEAGVGKTTLWEAALELGRERGYEILVCRPVESEAQLSFAALGDLVEPVREATIPALPSPQRAALEKALLLSDSFSPAPDQRAIALALLGVVRLLARSAPVLLAVDDVQWLDAPTAAVLEFALRRLQDEPVAVLLTHRSEGSPVPLALDRALPDDRVTHLAVGRLSIGAMHRLLHTRLGVTLPRPTLLRVHETSGGNPLYALELARALRSRPGPAVQGAPLLFPDTLVIPEALVDLMRERLDGLPASVQRLVRAASALSKPTIAVVAALEGSSSGIQDDLLAALDAGVIELEGERIRLTHPLLASAAYSQLSPAARRDLHRRLAQVVEDQEERARHMALGAVSPDVDVATALDEAALHAAGRGAPGAAAELSELAVRLTPAESKADAWRRGTVEARYLRSAGDFIEARRVLEGLLEEMPPGHERAAVLLLIAQSRTDDLEAADELCEQALREAHGDDLQLAEIELFLGELAVLRGRMAIALERARSASEAAERGGGKPLLVASLAAVALYETFTGEPTPGVLERALLLEQDLDAPPAASPAGVQARRFMYAGRLDEARAFFERRYADLNERGGDYDRGRFLFMLALIELRSGRWERAAQHAAHGYDLMEQAAAEQQKSAFLYPMSLIDAHLGRVDEARAAAEEGLALSQASNNEIFSIADQSVLGFLELSLGNAALAAGHLRELPGRLDAIGYGEPNIYPVLPDAIEALIGVDELEAADDLLEKLAKSAERPDSPWALATSLRCRGLLEAARGELPSALATLDRALAAHERMQQPFERARTLLVLGLTQRRAKQKRPARESLEAALAIFEELGARLWAEKARAELQRIGGRAPAPGELTPSEQRVAALVAEGKTNREVATVLYLSVRTVEGHLSRIYAKLGVRSRAELAHRITAGSAQSA
jgi:ATP/maltotriose-dependent transcriptional regulator MalT